MPISLPPTQQLIKTQNPTVPQALMRNEILRVARHYNISLGIII